MGEKITPLCLSCVHCLPYLRAGDLAFCHQEQQLTHPHLRCQRFQPAPDPDPGAVSEFERKNAYQRVE